MSSNAWKVAMEKAALIADEERRRYEWDAKHDGNSGPERLEAATASACAGFIRTSIRLLPEPPAFRAAVEAEMGEVVERLREATAAWEAVLALEENTSPFGGEIMRDRIERTMERAKASCSEARALLSRIGEGKP